MSEQTSTKKWVISLWSLLAVILIFNPITYWVTNKLFSIAGKPTLQFDDDPMAMVAPTYFGFVLHLIVFFLVVRGMMQLKLPGVDSE
jgi:hypothetical protein